MKNARLTILTPQPVKAAGPVVRREDLADGTALIMTETARGFAITLHDVEAELDVDVRIYPTREHADRVFDGAVGIAASL